MAQLQRMNACLDTFNDELCQVKTCVGRIAQRQAEMGGYTMPSTPVASTDESDESDSANDVDVDDDDATASDDEDDGDASSPSDDEMST